MPRFANAGNTVLIEIDAAAFAQLAPAGRLRVAINLGTVVLARADPQTGASRGVPVELATELGRRLGVHQRRAALDFTAPYVIIVGFYLGASAWLRR